MRRPFASLALVVHALLALECSDPKDHFLAEEAAESEGSTAGGETPTVCDLLATVELGTIIAVGQAEDGTILVVDQAAEGPPRVFISEDRRLVRAEVFGGAGGQWGEDQELVMASFTTSAGETWSVAAETRDGRTRMALARNQTVSGSFDNVLAAGEPLTVLDVSALCFAGEGSGGAPASSDGPERCDPLVAE